MNRFLFIFIFAAVIAHALMSAVAGSLVPSHWSALELLTCIFILAPCAALALAVLEGAFNEPPPTYTRRDRKRG
jgi:hypothetical protein